VSAYSTSEADLQAQLGPTEREIGALNDELNELTERRRPTQVALKKAKTELHKSQSKASFKEVCQTRRVAQPRALLTLCRMK
jgi:chromosome segregation ATPase